MKISSKPTLSFGMLCKNAGGSRDDIFPFNTGRCRYFYSARYALNAAISALKLSSHQAILLPAYNCWVEVDPFVRQGFKIDWYRVNKDFSIDEEDIIRRINPGTAAILVIHYLGFPQRLAAIRQICTDRGIMLIEDCAHALLSDECGIPLGSTGDMAVFSLRKTFPLPDGGCLLFNNTSISCESPSVIRPNRFATYYVLSEMLSGGSTLVNSPYDSLLRRLYFLNHEISRGVRLCLRFIHKVLQDRGNYLMYPSGNHFKDGINNWGLSKAADMILNKSNFQEVKARRRSNFLYLLDHLKEDKRFHLPIRHLPEGVCPLLFPVIVDDRDHIYLKLKSMGIAGHDWWGDFHPAVPWNDFPEAFLLKKRVYGVPIHQSISEQHLDFIIEQLVKYC